MGSNLAEAVIQPSARPPWPWRKKPKPNFAQHRAVEIPQSRRGSQYPLHMNKTGNLASALTKAWIFPGRTPEARGPAPHSHSKPLWTLKTL